MNRIDLSGRAAVVTGGAQGIGYAIARRLLASGATVTLWDLDSERLQEATISLGAGEGLEPGGAAVHGVTVDVSDHASVLAGVEATLAWARGIDILVNNAGITGPNAPVWEYPLAAWRRVQAVNLDGVFLCLREVVPHMIERGYGRIVNIASIAGKEGNPNAAAYSASKAAVIALTKSLGKELAGYDIGVNCVTPAAAKTAIFEQMTQEHIDYMLSKIPRGRFAETEEIAAMVAWLVSDENSFTTGGVFDLSGGRASY